MSDRIQKTIVINLDDKTSTGFKDIDNTFKQVDKSINKATNTTKSLKQELRDLQKEILSGKLTGQELQQAEIRAGKLRDTIGDLNAKINVLASDTKNLDGLVSAAEGIAGGFAIAQGAAALFGDENEQLNQALLKVQASMAILNGLQAVSAVLQEESAASVILNSTAQKAYTWIMTGSTTAVAAQTTAQTANVVSTEAMVVAEAQQTAALGVLNAATVANTTFTYAQEGAMIATTAATNGATLAAKALRVALVATGIGAIVVLVVSLVAAMNDYDDSVKAAEAAQKDFNSTLEFNKELLQDEISLIDFSTKRNLIRAKARGASEKELTKITIDGINERLAANQEEINRLEATDPSKITKEGYEELLRLRKENFDLEREGELVIEEFKANQAIKARENREKEREKIKGDKQKANQEEENAEKARLDKLNALQEGLFEQNRDLNAKTEQEKLDLQKTRDLERIKQVAKTEEELANLTALANEKYFILQQDLNKKLAEEQAKKDQEKIEKEDEQWLRLQELTMEKNEYDKLVLMQKFDEEMLAAEGNAELQKALREKLYADLANIDAIAAANKEAQLQNDLSNLSAILAVGGKKMQNISKALAIAEIVRDTIRAVNAATGNEIKVPAFIGVVPNPVKPASMASTILGIGGAIAKGAASIAAITSDSKSIPGGGGGAAGGMGGGGSAPTPQFNIVGASNVNQLASTIAGQQQRPVQAYVVGSDVTTQQSLDRNKVNNATFL